VRSDRRLLSTHKGYSPDVKFIEATPFSRDRPALMTDTELSELQTHLTDNPESGDSIKKTGGFRKIRWANSQRGKGKRSGSRTIYLHVDLAHTIYLAFIYDHEEKDDLSNKDRKELAFYAHEMKALAKKGRKP